MPRQMKEETKTMSKRDSSSRPSETLQPVAEGNHNVGLLCRSKIH